MKDKIINIGLIVTALILMALLLKFGSVEVKPDCQYCGRQYDIRHTEIKEMCDKCFGALEYKASLTENGIQVEFSNGEGYYFQGKN